MKNALQTGFYALNCQVNPDMTPKEFIEVVRTTSVTTDLEHGGNSYKFGNTESSAKVIKKLQK